MMYDYVILAAVGLVYLILGAVAMTAYFTITDRMRIKLIREHKVKYCPDCGGSGQDKWWTPCPHCEGTGYVKETQGNE